jgi:hypothetical protein
MPFLFAGDKLLAQPGDLEKQLEDTTPVFLAPSSLTLLPSEWTARNLDNGLRKVSATEQAFLARFRRREVRAVEIMPQLPTSGADSQGIMVLVRTNGGRLRIVGFDPGPCLPKLLSR